MDEIELSIMQRNRGEEQLLQPFLDSFQARHQHLVRLQSLNWVKGRSDLIKMALYHHGADVSEVGTTWISDLISMNALRPFSAIEVIQAGPAEAFLPAAWKTTQMTDQAQVWSLPWLTEAYTLHYRADILDQAGIDPAVGLSTPEQLLETVRQLKGRGYNFPIALPPLSSRNLIMHVAASWVWQNGGDFLNPNGKQVTIHEAQALRGIKTFLLMLREIEYADLQKLETPGLLACFCKGEAPLAIGGLWVHPDTVPEKSFDSALWGVTHLPGPPFVGGSNLVIWKHTHSDRAALALAQLLTGEAVSGSYAINMSMLPTRTRLAASAIYQNDRFLKTTFESVQRGRSYPTFALWGLVEDRISSALVGLWDRIARDPQLDIDETLARVLNQLAHSLDLTLSQR